MSPVELRQLIDDYVSSLETKPTHEICLCEWDKYGRRSVIKVSHPNCPVHTKEGLIVGFLTELGTHGYRLVSSEVDRVSIEEHKSEAIKVTDYAS